MPKLSTHFAAVLCCTLAAPALADNIRVPSVQAPTLRSALQAAEPGDRIVLAPGMHTGGWTDGEVDGLTIIGRRAQISGEVKLTGDGITVRGISFTEPDARLLVIGSGLRVERCRFRNGDLGGMLLQGDDIIVRRNRFETTFGGPAVEIRGERSRIERNKVEAVEDAFKVVGDQALIRANKVSETEIVVAIDGDAANVTRNRLVNVDAGLMVSGDEAAVTRNRVMGSFLGIQVEGDDFNVSRNRVGLGRVIVTRQRFIFQPGGDGQPLGPAEVRIRKTFDYFPSACPAVVAVNEESGGTVERNVVQHEIGGVAFDLHVNDVEIIGNSTDGPSLNGSGTSVKVLGQGNEVRNNRVRDFQLAGFRVVGADNEVRGNDVVSGAGTAIEVWGSDNAVCENDVIFAEFRSVHISGDDNAVEDNRVRYSWNDAFCIDGDQNTVSGNRVPVTYEDAFVVYGSNNILIDNAANDARRDGFRIARGSGNTLTDCSASGCGAEGLENLAQDTSVIDSTFRGNATDMENVGTFLMLDHAIFGAPQTPDVR